MADCPQCAANDGWVEQIGADGVKRFVPCDHGRSQKPEARSRKGFESAGEIVQGSTILNKMLTPKDRDIAAIIARRQGAALAVSIEDIARELTAGQEADGRTQEAVTRLWERSIKDSVRRLRRAGMKVGACRGSRDGKKAVGYFVISNAAELRSTVRPLLRQAIDELKTIEALTGKGMFAAELEGQARLFEAKESP